MKNQGIVSIIMPSYNTARYIGKSIESVLKQTYFYWELIIVDDCSTDDTYAVIKNYLSDERIIFIQSDVNRGAAVSRNIALKMAQGKWIAFLDSDDIWASEKLEKQLDYMIRNQYCFTYTDYMIQLNGKWLPYIYQGPKVVTKSKMKDYCYFSTITVIYDKEKVGLIQIEPLKKNNDYAMWLKVIEKTPCYRYPECLSYYIKHDGSISSGSKLGLIKYHYIMWRISEKKSVISAWIYTFRNMFWGFLKKVFYKKKVKILEENERCLYIKN